MLKRILRILVLILSICSIAVIGIYVLSSPRNDRDWTEDQTILPEVSFNENIVTINNIRNFLYTSETEYTPQYYSKTFNLDDLETVDFIVEPLASIAVAHTFVSFGFKDGNYISISVEIRKERGEEFSPLKGLLDQFELMYVIADERDVIRLRALHRKDQLFLYPINISKEKARELFVHMTARAQTLTQHPEFYNTLTSTCTTNIRDHVNAITDATLPWDMRVLFPLNSDEYAYELGLINTTLPLKEIRNFYEINSLVEVYADDPAFSERIRERARP